MAKIRVKGSEIIDEARRQGKRIIVLAGRPYHVDPEVNHGIDHLITRHGAAVVTEDSISNRVQKFPTSVLNQWTYHSRLYAAAKYCTTQKDMDLVQLVSFGCGVDAITTDETREILQRGNKLYTQLKIDEITNLGAVNIRLRSLFAALDERDEAAPRKRLPPHVTGEGAGRASCQLPLIRFTSFSAFPPELSCLEQHRRNLWNIIIPNLPRR